jgi:hypothetical protein
LYVYEGNKTKVHSSDTCLVWTVESLRRRTVQHHEVQAGMLFQLKKLDNDTVQQEYYVVRIGMMHFAPKKRKTRTAMVPKKQVCFVVWLMHRNVALREPVWDEDLLAIEAFWILGDNGHVRPSYATASTSIRQLGETAWLDYVGSSSEDRLHRRPRWTGRLHFEMK